MSSRSAAGGRGGQEARRQRRLDDAAPGRDDAVGASAAAGGHGGWARVSIPDQPRVVVEPVAAGHPVADRVEVGGAALGLVVVVDAEAAVEEPEAGSRERPPGGGRDPGLEPAHRPGALAGEDDPLSPGEAEDRLELVRLPNREEIDEAAAADVDQVLLEEMVAELHRAPAEPEEGDVGGLAGALAEGGVEAADQIRRVAARGREDADPRPAARPLGRQSQDQLADRPVRGARAEVVATEGEYLGSHRSGGLRGDRG
jgi:hypothetical protein